MLPCQELAFFVSYIGTKDVPNVFFGKADKNVSNSFGTKNGNHAK